MVVIERKIETENGHIKIRNVQPGVFITPVENQNQEIRKVEPGQKLAPRLPDPPSSPVGEDWAAERDSVNLMFSRMLEGVTRDGSKKRQAGSKPPWWRDDTHEAGLFSHLNKWKHGELADKDSQQHPLVHLAWRAMAIAYQQTYGQVHPSEILREYENRNMG